MFIIKPGLTFELDGQILSNRMTFIDSTIDDEGVWTVDTEGTLDLSNLSWALGLKKKNLKTPVPFSFTPEDPEETTISGTATINQFVMSSKVNTQRITFLLRLTPVEFTPPDEVIAKVRDEDIRLPVKGRNTNAR